MFFTYRKNYRKILGSPSFTFHARRNKVSKGHKSTWPRILIVCVDMCACVVLNERCSFFMLICSCTLHIFIHPDLIGIITHIKYWLKEMNLLILNLLRIRCIENKLL